jgi:hypothetical protein
VELEYTHPDGKEEKRGQETMRTVLPQLEISSLVMKTREKSCMVSRVTKENKGRGVRVESEE